MILTIHSHTPRDLDYYKEKYPFVMKRFSNCINLFYQDKYLFCAPGSNYLQTLDLRNLNTFLNLGLFLWEHPVENYAEVVTQHCGIDGKKLEIEFEVLRFSNTEEAKEWQDLNRVIRLRDYQFKTKVFDTAILLEVL